MRLWRGWWGRTFVFVGGFEVGGSEFWDVLVWVQPGEDEERTYCVL